MKTFEDVNKETTDFMTRLDVNNLKLETKMDINAREQTRKVCSIVEEKEVASIQRFEQSGQAIRELQSHCGDLDQYLAKSTEKIEAMNKSIEALRLEKDAQITELKESANQKGDEHVQSLAKYQENMQEQYSLASKLSIEMKSALTVKIEQLDIRMQSLVTEQAT